MSTVETVTPFAEIVDEIKRGRRRGLQVLLPVREVRRRLPLEPGAGRSASARSSGRPPWVCRRSSSTRSGAARPAGAARPSVPGAWSRSRSGSPSAGSPRPTTSSPSSVSPVRGGQRQPRQRRQPARRGASQAGCLGRAVSPLKPFTEGMEVLYFVGCYYSYDPRMQKVAVATANILKQGRRGVRDPGQPGELLRREHPQDGQRGGLQEPGQGEHQGLHRQRREAGPRLLASLLPHLQERVSRVHGQLRGRSHLRVPGGVDRERTARARRGVREEGHLPRPLLPGAAQRHLRRSPGMS